MTRDQSCSDRIEWTAIASVVQSQIDELARESDEEGRLTRLFGGPAMRRASGLVAGWMREAGLEVRRDVVGNVIGRREVTGGSSAGTWVIGSHIDTVRNAGRYDGALGVVLGIAAAAQTRSSALPFALEVVGFTDEEGARFGTHFLASRAYLDGVVSGRDLERQDAEGIALVTVLPNVTAKSSVSPGRGCPPDVLGYLEIHIEQGPVLDSCKLPLGVVTEIAGQATGTVSFDGVPGHAGTVPMSQRHDALCAAAELVMWIEDTARETLGLLGTVGEIAASPGARNVIPGHATVGVDLRHHDGAALREAVSRLRHRADLIARERGIRVSHGSFNVHDPVACDPTHAGVLADAVRSTGYEPMLITSGAGHDAAVLAERTGVVVLFVRCKDGVSHNPAESVSADDLRDAAATTVEFLRRVGVKIKGHESTTT